MTTMLDQIAIDRVRLDGGTQPRAAVDEDTIAEYAERMTAGDSFPPLRVYFDGQDHWLADGFHRVYAALRARVATLPAEVHPGDRRAAVLYSVGANAQHGLRRTAADKRRAVTTLLEDAEWSTWSDREIARQCGVSPSTVAAVRRDLTVQIGQSTSDRRGADGRVTNTAGIGKSRARTQVEPDPDLEPDYADEAPDYELRDEAPDYDEVGAGPLAPTPPAPRLTREEREAAHRAEREAQAVRRQERLDRATEGGIPDDPIADGVDPASGTPLPPLVARAFKVLDGHLGPALENLRKATATLTGLRSEIESLARQGLAVPPDVCAEVIDGAVLEQLGKVAFRLGRALPGGLCPACDDHVRAAGTQCWRCQDAGWLGRGALQAHVEGQGRRESQR